MTTARAEQRTYRGEATQAVAMPLGGIGTGTIAVAGDGSLRQWQVHNQINHLACVPQSFFAVRVEREGEEPVARALQTAQLYDSPPPTSPPSTSNDHVIPACYKTLMDQIPGVEDVEFSGTYPIAELRYVDHSLPVNLTMEAFSPFVPLDAEESGIPGIVFVFSVSNPGDTAVQVSLAASLQNSVGWDGLAEIVETRCEQYGGNANRVVRGGGQTSIAMESTTLPSGHPGWGSLALTAHTAEASALAQWRDTSVMWTDFLEDGAFDPSPEGTSSETGRTWNGSLAVPFTLDPGQSRDVTFTIAWSFPNRFIDQLQAGLLGLPPDTPTERIGNRYAVRFPHALDVASYLGDNLARFGGITRSSRDIFLDTTLPGSLIETVTSQMSIMRSPTCFWAEDGNFYGYEGCSGASSAHHALPWGGSCPLNCTHVWNYEMSLSRLFPGLERSMRDVEWHVQQHDSGYLPHRVILPLDAPRAWDFHQYGPDKPALDGLLGAVLKTYREYRASGDAAWLSQSWPSVLQAMNYVWNEKDPERSGVIEAEQPNTYDISIFGANTFIGSLYLAALRATEEMALLQGDDQLATECRTIFDRGRADLEQRLWNGEYYIQEVDLDTFPEQNWATGCHADQLLGQWWANALGLGYVLEPERVRQTARAIVDHNFRTDFHGVDQGERAFVAEDDQGLVLCTWPHGGRPEVPTRYSDEVWTGIEYEVAALLLAEGEIERALRIIDANRERHDGHRLNPWNDIECGDHYVRAMSSWTLLEAASGYQYDAGQNALSFAPVVSPNDFRAPFFTRDGWGTYSQRTGTVGSLYTIEAAHGEIRISELRVTSDGSTTDPEVTVAGMQVDCAARAEGNELVMTFDVPLTVKAGETLEVRL